MFEYKEERVKHIIKKDNRIQIISTQQVYEASWVFNSIPFQPPQAEKDIWLKQHFFGYFLETETNAFDPDEVTFMDFNTPYENAFFYILPLSPTSALVEFTVFSASIWSENIYKQQLHDYLKERKGIEQYTINEIEKGVIPMTSYVFPKMENERVINIGTRGGMTKPTTGYTYDVGIHMCGMAWVEYIVHTLLQGVDCALPIVTALRIVNSMLEDGTYV
jgi:lycopene beta-cyclase